MKQWAFCSFEQLFELNVLLQIHPRVIPLIAFSFSTTTTTPTKYNTYNNGW